MKGKFVKIQSTMNITVTGGLQAQDVTNKDAHVPDRLKVAALWPKTTVDIKQGVGFYPEYIKDWNTVKNLVKDKILTIGETTEEVDEEDKKKKEDLDFNMAEIEEKLGKKVKNINLDDIAGE